MKEQVTISFPGLGIGEFTVSKVAFSIGSIEIRWYALIIVLGIFAGVGYAMYRTKHERDVSAADIADYAIWIVLSALVGARLYYVLTSLDKYDSIWDAFQIWEGGIAIYGGIIGGVVAVLIVSRVKKFKREQMLRVLDMAAPATMIGQIIGRWGNFVNGEAHGPRIFDEFFLRMGLKGDADVEWALRGETTYYHPTFLYESLWNLIGFVLIHLFYKKKKFDGQIFLMYLAWYGFGRMLIESIRTDSLMIGPFRVSMVVGFLCFAVCTALLILFGLRERRRQKATEEYSAVYGASHAAMGAKSAQNDAETTSEKPSADGEKE